MYARQGPQGRFPRNVHIPQNYSGNAFRKEEKIKEEATEALDEEEIAVADQPEPVEEPSGSNPSAEEIPAAIKDCVSYHEPIKHGGNYQKTLNARFAVYQKLLAQNALELSCPIISADTIVFCDDEIMGKPKDRADAYRMLKKLSGKAHTVTTGICIVE